MPSPLEEVDQVNSTKLLGVFLSSNLKFNEHIKYLLAQCSQKMYLLKLIRNQGLDRDSINTICHALIISRVLYALSSWGGFISAEQTSSQCSS